MKKTLLLSVLAGASVVAYAQNAGKTTKKLPSKYDNVVRTAKIKPRTDAVEVMLPTEHISPVYSAHRSVPTEAILGTTGYHLQTNSSVRNAIVKGNDGTIGAVWTTSVQTSAWSDRGTGYNYFDGSAWGAAPTVRIENIRTGWPNLVWPSNGSELVTAHQGGSGAQLVSRSAKGTGNWTTASKLDPSITTSVWPRMVADGNNVHHLINRLGAKGPIAYSRSTDGGVTWDKLSIEIPGTDTLSYTGFGGDNYAIAAKNGKVAVVTGGWDVDVALFKSDDNGETWTKTVILTHPKPLWDYTVETLDSSFVNAGGDVAVTIDNNGIAHVSFSACSIRTTALDGTYNYWPGTSDLLYWNQHMGAGNFISLGNNAYLDFNNNGVIDIPTTGPSVEAGNDAWGSYEPGFYNHPSLGVDANNNVYLAYDALAEIGDTTIWGQMFRHVFVLKSVDGGYTWSDQPTDAVPSVAMGGDGEFQEAVWPSIAPDVDGNVHIVYHRDPAPGIQNVSGTPVEPDATNNNGIIADVIYVALPVADIAVGGKKTALTSNSVTVFPNPAKAAALVNVNLAQAGKINVSVFNALGAEVLSANNNNATVGINSISLNTSALTAGVYFVKTNANGVVSTTKLIVE